MSNNLYRGILGAILLISLYFNFEVSIYVAFSIVTLEGLTNWRVPMLVNRIRNIPEDTSHLQANTRFSFESERAFRLLLGVLVLITYYYGEGNMLWFFPWFMGFAILGAGVSGLCPGVALVKWLGFR